MGCCMLGELVCVKWKDASGGSLMGWRDLSEIKDNPTGEAVSVGYLIKDDDFSLVICPHVLLDDDNKPEQGDGEITIPKDWVSTIYGIVAVPDGVEQ